MWLVSRRGYETNGMLNPMGPLPSPEIYSARYSRGEKDRLYPLEFSVLKLEHYKSAGTLLQSERRNLLECRRSHGNKKKERNQ